MMGNWFICPKRVGYSQVSVSLLALNRYRITWAEKKGREKNKCGSLVTAAPSRFQIPSIWETRDSFKIRFYQHIRQARQEQVISSNLICSFPVMKQLHRHSGRDEKQTRCEARLSKKREKKYTNIWNSLPNKSVTLFFFFFLLNVYFCICYTT